MSSGYEEYYRSIADGITDAELRSLGMSAHELLRVRALPPDERFEAISGFLLGRSLSGLSSRAMTVWLHVIDRTRILDD